MRCRGRSRWNHRSPPKSSLQARDVRDGDDEAPAGSEQFRGVTNGSEWIRQVLKHMPHRDHIVVRLEWQGHEVPDGDVDPVRGASSLGGSGSELDACDIPPGRTSCCQESALSAADIEQASRTQPRQLPETYRIVHSMEAVDQRATASALRLIEARRVQRGKLAFRDGVEEPAQPACRATSDREPAFAQHRNGDLVPAARRAKRRLRNGDDVSERCQADVRLDVVRESIGPSDLWPGSDSAPYYLLVGLEPVAPRRGDLQPATQHV